MTAPDLLPCPFCGSKAVAFSYITEGAVRCGGCHAAITRGHKHTSETGYDEAIAAWNSRPTPLAEALAVPEVAALVKAMERLLPAARHYGGLTDEHVAAIMGAEATIRNFRKVSPVQHSLTTDAALRAIGDTTK